METDRIILRPWRDSDVETLFKWDSDPDVGPSCECDLPAREGEPLIGYWVAKPYWNQGMCTEALRLMLVHIRETTDIKSLISGHFVAKPASGRVMEKCGFVPTGETCIDESLAGSDRPMRVLRLEIKRFL